MDIVLDQFGDHLVLLGQLLVELLDLVFEFICLGGFGGVKGRRPVFKEGLLPLVKLGGSDAVLARIPPTTAYPPAGVPEGFLPFLSLQIVCVPWP